MDNLQYRESQSPEQDLHELLSRVVRDDVRNENGFVPDADMPPRQEIELILRHDPFASKRVAKAKRMLAMLKPFEQWKRERNPSPHEIEVWRTIVSELNTIAAGGHPDSLSSQ